MVPVADAEALVWTDPRDPGGLEEILDASPQLRWIQLPYAGVENFVHLVDDDTPDAPAATAGRTPTPKGRP